MQPLSILAKVVSPFLDRPKESVDLVLSFCFKMLEIGEVLDWSHRLVADQFINSPDPSSDKRIPVGDGVDQGRNVSLLKELAFIGDLFQDAQFLGVVQQPTDRKMCPQEVGDTAATVIAGILGLAESTARPASKVGAKPLRFAGPVIFNQDCLGVGRQEDFHPFAARSDIDLETDDLLGRTVPADPAIFGPDGLPGLNLEPQSTASRGGSLSNWACSPLK